MNKYEINKFIKLTKKSWWKLAPKKLAIKTIKYKRQDYFRVGYLLNEIILSLISGEISEVPEVVNLTIENLFYTINEFYKIDPILYDLEGCPDHSQQEYDIDVFHAYNKYLDSCTPETK